MIKPILKNKKGATFSSWTEALLFSGAFLILLGTVILGMNGIYDKNHGSDFGLDNVIFDNLTTLEGSLESGIESGEADFGGDGLQFSALWSLLLAIWTMVTSLVTGAWIPQLISLIGLPAVMGLTLRLAFLFSVIYILIRGIMKIKP